MTGDFAALWAGVLAAPDDAAPKLVLADWLADHDADPDLEAGLRWGAEYEWFPPAPNMSALVWGTYVATAKRWAEFPDRHNFVSEVCVSGIRPETSGLVSVCGCAADTPDECVRIVGRAVRKRAASQMENSPSSHAATH